MTELLFTLFVFVVFGWVVSVWKNNPPNIDTQQPFLQPEEVKQIKEFLWGVGALVMFVGVILGVFVLSALIPPISPMSLIIFLLFLLLMKGDRA